MNKVKATLKRLSVPLIAILFAFIFGAVLIILSGKDPILAYGAMFKGAFGSFGAISTVLNKATPLILTGLAVSIAYQCKSINIGAEGQLVFGAFGASLVGAYVSLPIFLHIPLVIISGFAFGAAWAFIPAMLKIKKDVNTVISTIMMNYIAFAVVRFLINTFFRADNSDLVAMPWFKATARLPLLLGNPIRLSSAIIIALLAAVVIWYLLNRTVVGYEIKAVGLNPNAANSNGIKANKNIIISLLISGGLAGIAGATEIMAQFGKLYDAFAPGYGFDGIPVALLARGNPLGVILTALLFSILRTGAVTMQTSVGVSRTIVDAMQGVIILFIAGEYLFTKIKLKRSGGKKS